MKELEKKMQEAVKRTMDTMEPAQTPAEIRETLEGTQIGEFAFIIASLGVSLHVTSHFLYPIVVAVSASEESAAVSGVPALSRAAIFSSIPRIVSISLCRTSSSSSVNSSLLESTISAR